MIQVERKRIEVKSSTRLIHGNFDHEPNTASFKILCLTKLMLILRIFEGIRCSRLQKSCPIFTKKSLHLNKTHKVFRHSLMHKTQSIDLKKLKKEGERSQRKPKKPPTTAILQCNLLYFTSACTRFEPVLVVVANLSKCTGSG